MTDIKELKDSFNVCPLIYSKKRWIFKIPYIKDCTAYIYIKVLYINDLNSPLYIKDNSSRGRQINNNRHCCL